MDMSCLNGAARMAYFTGMQALQEKGHANDRMLIATKLRHGCPPDVSLVCDDKKVDHSTFAQILSETSETKNHNTKNILWLMRILRLQGPSLQQSHGITPRGI